MKNFYFLLLSIFIFVTTKTPNSEFCQKIKCYSEIGTDTCIKVESRVSLMNPCPNSKICNSPSEDPIDDSYCIDKNLFAFKKLPSLPCDSIEECISSNCDFFNHVCVGKGDGDGCDKPEDCNYGKTCRKHFELDENFKKCLDPMKEGDKCEVDTDCEINCGCMKGICTQYFSLDNWEQTGGLDYFSDFNFCKSGYVNEVGICMNISLQNEITECSDLSPCQYEYEEQNNEKKNLTIYSNCLCGYNPLGKQYCLLGSGNYNFTRYLEKLKKYHLNNKNCHLSERTAGGCQKDIINGTKETLLQINELINAKYWAKANNRLIDAPECVFSVELPDYNRTLDKNQNPEPLYGKCAKYFCKDKIEGGICAKSNYINDFEINVTLADVCSNNIKCELNGKPNDVFYNKTSVEARCGSNTFNKRYPGEKCQIDSECIYPLNNPSSQFHKCEEGVCNGMDEGGICEDNSWCIVGLYCDKYEGRCKKQIKKGESCLESKDCKNNLICANGKCSELFSLEDGNSVPEKEYYDIQRKFCKNGEVEDNKCVSFNDFDGTKLSDNEYKKCDFNSYCEYKINGLGDGRIKYVRCGCGYNSEGQGYCPHFHDYSKDDWEQYRNLWKKKSDNKCHTESRFDCYLYDEEESELKTYINKVENGHLFYNCEECAKKVLGSNYININRILFIILGFLALII